MWRNFPKIILIENLCFCYSSKISGLIDEEFIITYQDNSGQKPEARMISILVGCIYVQYDQI